MTNPEMPRITQTGLLIQPHQVSVSPEWEMTSNAATKVGPSSFQGEQNLDTRKCYVYKQGTQMAWIDKSTLLPIQYDSDLMHVTYTYGVPDYPLQLPANCLKKEQQMRRSWSGQPN
jgi:hypothetical protein